jgi:hypothetical protein
MTNLIRSRLSPSFAGPTFGDINSALFFADTQTQHDILHCSLLVKYVIYLSELLHLDSGPASAETLRAL